MASTALQGIIIGILVSAPMGPIGVLCVQRTLNKNRLHGLSTGFGAMASDMVYAVIAGLGMGFIVDFINNNLHAIQIIGSLVLLVFGYILFKSNPTTQLQKQTSKKESRYWQDFLSAFLLNLSNVGIFFYFIAMFARFSFITSDNMNQNILGLISIAMGIMIWWFGISYIVDRLRSRFNLRALNIFNKVLGTLLAVIGVVGFFSGIYQWRLF